MSFPSDAGLLGDVDKLDTGDVLNYASYHKCTRQSRAHLWHLADTEKPIGRPTKQ